MKIVLTNYYICNILHIIRNILLFIRATLIALPMIAKQHSTIIRILMIFMNAYEKKCIEFMKILFSNTKDNGKITL